MYLLRLCKTKGSEIVNESEGLLFVKSLPKEEKAKLFDCIVDEYYNVNFGHFSKSQIDLLMFSIYLDKLIDTGQNFDDYTISKQLGILQSTVRQLKKKKQLIYPRNYKWYESFLEYSKNAVFDNSGRIVISIPDPNVYLELQHAIEELGGYVEIQLNSKLLKIPPGYYIELLLRINQLDNECDEKEALKLKANFIKKLNKRYLEDEKLEGEFTDKTFLTKLKEQGLEIGLDILKDMIPGGTVIANGIVSLSKNLFDK